MQVPITIRPEATTPIYLQIRYQIAHLITSGALKEGFRLPTVRAVAEDLAVNPGTVAQAYRALQQQGLLQAAPGRGTFVAPPPPLETDAAERRALLDDTLRRALLRARALGFDDTDVAQHFDRAIVESEPGRPALFAAPTMVIARKYATSIERRIGPRIAVHSVTFDDLAQRSPRVLMLLDVAYFVLTFAGLVRDVERSVATLGRPARVLGCASVVQEHTLHALAALDSAARVCLVTQEPYLPPTLNLLTERTGRPASDFEVVLDGDHEAADRVLPHCDRVVYTLAAREFVVTRGVPAERRLEVTFDLTDDAIERVRATVLADGDSTRT